jgi:hypothetical protein
VHQPRGHRHRREARGVGGQPELGSAGGGQDAGEQRAGGEADVARGLEPAVGLRQIVVRHRGGHERGLRRPGDGRAGGEHRGEDEDRREPVGEDQPDGDRGLRERDEQQQPARLDPVDEPAGERGEQDDRGHQRPELGGDGEARAGQVVHAQREHDHEQHVAGGGQRGGGGEEAEVAGHPLPGRPARPPYSPRRAGSTFEP